MLRFLALIAAATGALLATGVASADTAASSIDIQQLERIGDSAYLPGPVVGHPGDRIQYQIIVTNNGDQPVTIGLSAPRCTDVTVAGSDVVQPYGGYVVFQCSHLLGSGERTWTNPTAVTVTTADAQTLSITPVSSAAEIAVIGNLQGAHHVIRHKKRKHTPAV